MKKRIRNTGEIVDVVAWYNIMGAAREKGDSVSYIDSNGNEHVKVKGLNLAWDFEDAEEAVSAGIDWEEVRIKAAISALQGFAASPQIASTETLVEWSVRAADALIAELKKKARKHL